MPTIVYGMTTHTHHTSVSLGIFNILGTKDRGRQELENVMLP